MQRVDTSIAARWVVPVEPEGVVLHEHSLIITEDRIVDLLPQAEAAQRYGAKTTVHLGAHVLIPGLVNAHTHAAMSLLRGLADDLPLMEWLNDHIWPTEGRWIGPEFVRDGTELAVAEMMLGGVTCFNDMYFFPEVVAEVSAHCGMRAMVGLIAVEFPSAWARTADEYLDKGMELYSSLDGNRLVRCVLAPHAPYTLGDDALRRVARLAEDHDLPVHIHVHETASEIEQSLVEHGRRPLQRLDELGLVNHRLIAVHMTQLTDDEIDEVISAGASVVHCPESNLKLASGFAPVAKLAAAGARLALGTDGAASNNDLDLLGEMRTAALIAKGVAGDATALPVADVLRMATLGGAEALGLGDEIGSLVPGKAADVVALDLGGLCSQPVYDPLSQLVYATGRHQVSDVWIGGRRVVEHGTLTTVDAERLGRVAREWRARISGS